MSWKEIQVTLRSEEPGASLTLLGELGGGDPPERAHMLDTCTLA